jgi:hypothetical protein
MLNFEEMKLEELDKEIHDFIQTSGRNHVALLRAWESHPEYKDDLDALYQQLCYCVAHDRKESSRRIFGRFKVIRNIIETERLKVALGDEKDVLS